jgi:hypothetical protein
LKYKLQFKKTVEECDNNGLLLKYLQHYQFYHGNDTLARNSMANKVPALFQDFPFNGKLFYYPGYYLFFY